MTTKELYSVLGVSGYEHLNCWRKSGIFHLRKEAPASCYLCPQCGNREVIRPGKADRIVHSPHAAIGIVRRVSMRRLNGGCRNNPIACCRFRITSSHLPCRTSCVRCCARPKQGYDAIFNAGAATIRDMLANPKWLGSPNVGFFGVAISNNRILECKEQTVTIKYKPSKSSTYKTRTVEGVEFVKGFLQHVLPKDVLRNLYFPTRDFSHFPIAAIRCNCRSR